MRLFLFSLLFFYTPFAFCQKIDNTFNRLNYHQYDWFEKELDSLLIIFPKGYERLADYSLNTFPNISKELSANLGLSTFSSLNVILYPSEIEHSESNVGIYDNILSDKQIFNLKIPRILIGFKGSYEELKSDFQFGLLNFIWQKEIYSKNNFLFRQEKKQIPFWFKSGFMEYLIHSWTFESEESLNNCFLNSDIEDWNTLISLEPQLAGTAFCYYLELIFRKDACQKIFSLLRDGKSLQEATWIITKKPFPNVVIECFNFYKNRFIVEGSHFHQIEGLGFVNPQNNKTFFIPNPNSDTFTSFYNFKRNIHKVYIKNTITRKKTLIFKSTSPPWMGNENIFKPQLVWDKNNNLFIKGIKKNRINILQYDKHGDFKNKYILHGLDGINNFFIVQSNLWILDAYKKGFSELLSFNPNKLKYNSLTKNINDKEAKGILETKSNNYLFVYYSKAAWEDVKKDNNSNQFSGLYLMEINNNGLKIESEKPIVFDSLFLKWNQTQKIEEDRIQTKFKTFSNFLDLKEVQNNKEILDILKEKKAWVNEWLYFKDFKDSLNIIEINASIYERNNLNAIFKQEVKKNPIQSKQNSLFVPYQIRLYDTKLIIGLENDFLFNRYQPYQSYLGEFTLPDLNALAQVKLNDFFDNYFIGFGYKLPITNKGSTYIFSFKNLKYLTDWHFNFYRAVQSITMKKDKDWKDENNNFYPPAIKIKSLFIEVGLERPISYASSFHFSTALRTDKTVFLANNTYSLKYPNLFQKSLINTFTFETKSIPLMSEMGNNAYFQKGGYFKNINDIIISFNKPKNILYSTQVQANYRYSFLSYLWSKISLQTGLSLGNKKMLFIFGGVENNLTPLVNDTIEYSQYVPYQFQTLINPFRGYAQNIFYGDKYLLLNVDFYSKPLQQIIPTSTSISFLNNLSVGFFLDGLIVSGQQVTGIPNYEQFAFSFGISLKTKLAGYPLRFDLGWPGSFKQKALFYLSFDL